jgi:hypothetical protein
MMSMYAITIHRTPLKRADQHHANQHQTIRTITPGKKRKIDVAGGSDVTQTDLSGKSQFLNFQCNI